MSSPIVGPDGLPYWEKDPNATKDYTADWTAWLGVDTIQSSVWVVEAGLTEGAKTNTTLIATIWLSGGTHGKTYKVTNRVTTLGGRIEERSFNIVAKNQ